ncbi:MAG: NAD-dependent epimerase/dehydratase family protein [Sphingobacteriaceae bacterium]|nr:MAG: NAD-dependent epimerase/dehydratase family protein [Sphingobacteriaceae bacterium]
MKIGLIGASGFVGTAILKEALNRNYEVVAIVRNPENISIQNKNLTVKKGDVLEENTVAGLVQGCDVVVSAYNPGWSNPDICNQIIQGSKSIQNGVKQAQVKRLIVIGGGGSLEVAPGLQAVDTPEFPQAIKPAASSVRDYLNILKEEKELDWTFFSPALEMHQGTSGMRKGQYRLGLDNPVYDENGRNIMSVEDVAVVIMDEIEVPKHSRQRFTAGY